MAKETPGDASWWTPFATAWAAQSRRPRWSLAAVGEDLAAEVCSPGWGGPPLDRLLRPEDRLALVDRDPGVVLGHDLLHPLVDLLAPLLVQAGIRLGPQAVEL